MEWLEKALQRAEVKIEHTLKQKPEGFPHFSEGDHWTLSPKAGWEDTHGDWTAGFWPGLLWNLYELTGKPYYCDQARYYTGLLESRLGYDSHDMGFLLFPSCVRGYELTGEPVLRDWALQGADRLVHRFHSPAGFISIKGLGQAEGVASIDTMMNLPLLWWAHRETAREDYLQAALSHARSSARHFLRPDGSTWHIIRFSTDTGEVLWKGTWQGYSDESCWSRGQAWALCGFLTASTSTGLNEFDGPIDLLFQYVAENLPENLVPYWDYQARDSSSPWRDSSASAIKVSGLLQSAVFDTADRVRKQLTCFGLTMLRSLVANCSVEAEAPEPGLLRQGCFHAPARVGTNSCLIFGDYYYLDALLNARRLFSSCR